MITKRPLLLLLSLLLLSALACSALGGDITPEIPAPPTLVINSPVPATQKPGALEPTATLAAGIPESTADLPTLRAIVDVNVRTGPGVIYERDGFLLGGEAATIIGRDPATGWWKIACPERSEGEECWVTGEERFTSASDTDGIPVAEAPPTPTPAPTSAATAAATPTQDPTATPTGEATSGLDGPIGLLLAYVDNGDLHLARLNLRQDQVSAGNPVRVTNTGDVVDVYISPEGGRVAFIRGTEGHNALYVMDVATGEETLLVDAADLPALSGPGTNQTIRLIDQVQWLPGGEAIAFNTQLVFTTGPGVLQAFDLWLVRPGEAPEERFPANTAGGYFTISPSYELLMSSPTSIVRADLEGNEPQEVVVTFDVINTASEYYYLPRPQWLPSGDEAYVAIPDADPWVEEPEFSLWYIPAAGEAQLMERLSGNILFDPVYWSPSGDALAYVRRSTGGHAPRAELILADEDGDDDESYARGLNLMFLAWAPNGQAFLYSDHGFIAVGSPERAPRSTVIDAGDVATAGEWLTRNVFVVAIGGGPDGRWRFLGGNAAGESGPLLNFSATFPIFDVWAPGSS